MSQNVVIVTYYPGRRKRVPSADYTGEMWVVAEVWPAADAPVPSQRSVDWPLDAAYAGELGEQLRKAVADVLAGRVEGLVWKADDLSEDQLAGFIAGLPDRLQTLADQPLDALGRGLGMPTLAASLTSAVAGTMLFEPVREPVENTVHGLEVAGVVIGLLTGGHGLVLICVKHLAHDMLGDLLSNAFGRLIEPARPAPAPPPLTLVTPVSADDVREPARPQGLKPPGTEYVIPAPPPKPDAPAAPGPGPSRGPSPFGL